MAMKKPQSWKSGTALRRKKTCPWCWSHPRNPGNEWMWESWLSWQVHGTVCNLDYCNYCNAILAGSPRSMTSYNFWETRQHVSSLVHVSSITVCHDCCTMICTGLTFLDVLNRGLTTQCTTVSRVRHPSSLPTVKIVSRRHLRSSSRHHLSVSRRLRNDLYCVEWDVKLYYTIPYLSVPRHRLSTFDRRAFSVAGQTVWNSARQPPRPGSHQQQQLQATRYSAQ